MQNLISEYTGIIPDVAGLIQQYLDQRICTVREMYIWKAIHVFCIWQWSGEPINFEYEIFVIGKPYTIRLDSVIGKYVNMSMHENTKAIAITNLKTFFFIYFLLKHFVDLKRN